MTNPSLEKVAATQYMWRNMLISALKKSILDPALAKKLPEIPKGSKILTFNYDTGERYLSLEGLF